MQLQYKGFKRPAHLGLDQYICEHMPKKKAAMSKFSSIIPVLLTSVSLGLMQDLVQMNIQ